MKLKILAICGVGAILCGASLTAQAIDCEYTVIQVQPEGDKILFEDSDNKWHNGGKYTNPATPYYHYELQTADKSGLPVTVRYAGFYDCAATEYDTEPSMIR